MELCKIKRLRITEEIGEAPHAWMQRERQRSTASGMPWRAASARLDQGLSFYDTLSDEHREAFHKEWPVWKRALQVRVDREHRPTRISHTHFLEKLYDLSGLALKAAPLEKAEPCEWTKELKTKWLPGQKTDVE